jgi:hypothetical protein
LSGLLLPGLLLLCFPRLKGVRFAVCGFHIVEAATFTWD